MRLRTAKVVEMPVLPERSWRRRIRGMKERMVRMRRMPVGRLAMCGEGWGVEVPSAQDSAPASFPEGSHHVPICLYGDRLSVKQGSTVR